MKTGTVKWFDDDKGYGFIVNEAGQDVFVHYTVIEGRDRTLEKGETVSFQEETTDRGLKAVNVTRQPDVNPKS